MQQNLIPAAKQADDDKLTETGERRPQNRIRRYCAYFTLKWTLQLLCASIVVFAIIWSGIQITRLSNFLGVSEEPPGLKYYVASMTPDPPPPPPPIPVGR
tara:strand:+ start:183 stop:482 length:300 start_codon:yes stop_codon:yes gene_type:complete